MPEFPERVPDAWVLFDAIVRSSAFISVNPWVPTDGPPAYSPDFATLSRLLGVPHMLGSKPTTGLPALAIDVWIAYELRRAGFNENAVWPRAGVPRVLPAAISKLIEGMPRRDAAPLQRLLESGRTFDGAVGSSARVLGKNYFKQVDVGMSDWDTGPEILISTKRMDASFSNNAPNRIEESYGDAKNLRLRHPLAALGFVFALRSTALVEAPVVVEWIKDLLQKLGREDDAYDCVMLVLPDYEGDSLEGEPDPDFSLIEAGLMPEPDLVDVASGAVAPSDIRVPPVAVNRLAVPEQLSPERFFATLIRKVLNATPITRHEKARSLLRRVEVETD